MSNTKNTERIRMQFKKPNSPCPFSSPRALSNSTISGNNKLWCLFEINSRSHQKQIQNVLHPDLIGSGSNKPEDLKRSPVRGQRLKVTPVTTLKSLIPPRVDLSRMRTIPHLTTRWFKHSRYNHLAKTPVSVGLWFI